MIGKSKVLVSWLESRGVISNQVFSSFHLSISTPESIQIFDLGDLNIPSFKHVFHVYCSPIPHFQKWLCCASLSHVF